MLTSPLLLAVNTSVYSHTADPLLPPHHPCDLHSSCRSVGLFPLQLSYGGAGRGEQSSLAASAPRQHGGPGQSVLGVGPMPRSHMAGEWQM